MTDQMYRVVITTEIFVSCENRQQARELAIKNLREGNFGDWEITYVGRSEGDDEVDVTDNTEDLP